MINSLDDKVEAWIERLESECTEADEADSDVLHPSNLHDTQEIVTGRQSPARQPAADFEARLVDQMAMLSSARRELARTEQLVEMMKAVSSEIRALREELGHLKRTSSEVSTLLRDVSDIKDLFTRMSQRGAARRKASNASRTDPD